LAITDEDVARTVALVLADVVTTIGPGHEELVRANAERLREFIDDDPHYYFQRVVEDTQQDLHDEFIDTDWPRCPLHGRHPLWLGEGGWWCEQDHVLIAPVGQLGPQPGD
jgi:hypothetical protein